MQWIEQLVNVTRLDLQTETTTTTTTATAAAATTTAVAVAIVTIYSRFIESTRTHKNCAFGCVCPAPNTQLLPSIIDVAMCATHY